MVVLKILLGIGLGAGFGALMGMTRSCETGSCPLTANPWRGAIFGGVIGLLFAFTLIRPENYPQRDEAGAAPPQEAVVEDESNTVDADANKEEHLESLNEENFSKTVSEGVVLVDFWAPWCGPCRQQLPILEGLAKKVGDNAQIAKVNVDSNQAVSREFRVSSIPTLILFADGEPVQRFVGVQSERVLLNAISNAAEKVASKDSGS